MKRLLYLIIFCAFSTLTQAQHIFQGTSLSEALIELDRSSKHYDISFVYDELEDFTVTKTVKRGRYLPDAVREEWMKKIPMRRGGTPADVANVAAFLGSDLSAYVTGQVINVCGGMLT